jgi:two-component system, NarL family, sensor histidine kinase DesK
MIERVRPDIRRGGWDMLWLPLSVVWLTLLISPTTDTADAQRSTLGRAAVVAGAAAFVLVYLWMGRNNAIRRPVEHRGWRARWVPVGILTGLSVAMNLGYGREWSVMFIFTSAAVGIYLFPRSVAFCAVAAEILLSVAVGWWIGEAWPDIGGTAMVAGAVGSTMFLLVGVGVANRELRAAREELARLAVTEERLRFARDLHDLLGHSLSLIALKSELAGRLVAVAPERAAAEIADVEAVARQALAEVREAVAGYRQPTLAEELRGAGEILAAAGIALEVEAEPVVAPAAVEAALGWAVREGVTNVIRHSRARRCRIVVSVGDGLAGVEVTDDGRAVVEGGRSGTGSGLAGLRERVEALGGRFEAGPRPEGGFRLVVWVPVEEAVAGTGPYPPGPLSPNLRGKGEQAVPSDAVSLPLASGVGATAGAAASESRESILHGTRRR